eukprot:6172785-Pleurochrysis_carterae.AAC.3
MARSPIRNMVFIFRGNRHHVKHNCRSDVSNRVARDNPHIPPSAYRLRMPFRGPFWGLVRRIVTHAPSPLCAPYALLVTYLLPTLLCTRRVYVWAPSKLVTKPSDISATVRSWTDGRIDSLRGKTVVTSHLFILEDQPTRAHTIVCPCKTEPLSTRQRA